MAAIHDGETNVVESIKGHPWIGVAPTYVAINGFKRYDFDPNTGILRLDRESFPESDLEIMALEIGKVFPKGKTIKLAVPDYGDRIIVGVREIQYASPTELKVEYPQQTPSLARLIGSTMANLFR